MKNLLSFTKTDGLKIIRSYIIISYLIVPISLVFYSGDYELPPPVESLLLVILIVFVIAHPLGVFVLIFSREKRSMLTLLYFLLSVGWAYSLSILLLLYTLTKMY